MAGMLYFGYGATADAEIMAAIIGHSPELIGKAVLRGFELHVQTMDEIILPPATKQLLLDTWGKDFRSYGLRQAESGTSVEGVIYNIDDKDLVYLDDWEMVARGWFMNIKAEAILKDNEKKITDVVVHILAEKQHSTPAESQTINNSLGHKEKLIQVAKMARAS